MPKVNVSKWTLERISKQCAEHYLDCEIFREKIDCCEVFRCKSECYRWFGVVPPKNWSFDAPIKKGAFPEIFEQNWNWEPIIGFK